jgi:Tfp pilus assembly protein PilF
MFLRTGYARFGADDLDGARRSFRKAMEADRAAEDAPYALALLEAEAGNTLAARDLLKVVTNLAPRFARAYADLARVVEDAVSRYAGDVRERRFPGPDEVYGDPSPPLGASTRGSASGGSSTHD